MRIPDGVREYFTIDPRSLAAFRIGLGTVVLLDLAERVRQLEAHYTDFGVLPRAVLRSLAAHPVYSFHMASGELWFQATLFIVHAIVAVLMTLGVFTRTATVLTYLFTFSLQRRNDLINHGGETFELMLLMWAVFVPLGAVWSLDARRRGAPAARGTFSSGSLGLTLQPIFLYTIVTVSKLQYSSWTEGRAVYAFLHKAHYVRPLGEWVLTVPGLTTYATYATVVTEAVIACLLASPWRRPLLRSVGVLLGIGFHAVLFSMVRIGYFQPLAALSALPLLPREFWDGVGAHTGRVAALDTPRAPAVPRTPVAPARILRRVPNVIAGALACCVILSVPPNLMISHAGYPEPLASVYRVLQIDQRFRMFANMDRTSQGWWVVAGTLADGRTVDAIEMREGVSFARPERYQARLPNDNWRIYWSNISRPGYARLRPFLAEYFCRRWNRAASPPDRMVSIEVIHVTQRVTHPGQLPATRPVTLVRGPCPAPQ